MKNIVGLRVRGAVAKIEKVEDGWLVSAVATGVDRVQDLRRAGKTMCQIAAETGVG